MKWEELELSGGTHCKPRVADVITGTAKLLGHPEQKTKELRQVPACIWGAGVITPPGRAGHSSLSQGFRVPVWHCYFSGLAAPRCGLAAEGSAHPAPAWARPAGGRQEGALTAHQALGHRFIISFLILRTT